MSLDNLIGYSALYLIVDEESLTLPSFAATALTTWQMHLKTATSKQGHKIVSINTKTPSIAITALSALHWPVLAASLA